jgi:hypothetical protein
VVVAVAVAVGEVIGVEEVLTDGTTEEDGTGKTIIVCNPTNHPGNRVVLVAGGYLYTPCRCSIFKTTIVFVLLSKLYTMR